MWAADSIAADFTQSWCEMERALRMEAKDFPSGPVVKESACQSRGQRFDPWSKKIAQTMEHLSLCTTTTEAHALRPVCMPQHEKPLR